jgi:hypothetical protein
MAGTDSAVWLASYEDDTVLKVDPSTNRVALDEILIHGPSAFVFSAQSTWVARTRGSWSPG